jgi:hypothetical protein
VIEYFVGGGSKVVAGVTSLGGLAVDSSDVLYIADRAASRVLRVPTDGGAQTTIGTGLRSPFGVAGTGTETCTSVTWAPGR